MTELSDPVVRDFSGPEESGQDGARVAAISFGDALLGRMETEAPNAARGMTVAQARAELSARPLVATSGERVWSGVSLDRFDGYEAHDFTVGPRDHHVVTLALGFSKSVFQARCGRQQESDCRPGEAAMIPAGFGGRWRGYMPSHLRIALATSAVAKCGEDLKAAGVPQAELRNGFRVRDPALEHFGEIFRLELDRSDHPAQQLILSSVAAAFCVHVVRSYTGATGVEPRGTDCADTAAIRRTVAYLHDVEGARPTLDELAAIAGVSRFHFSRMFAKATGLPPTRYLERLRVERAKDMIRSSGLPLVQVALAVGFADQSHFTRRFRRWVGCTPARFARDNA